MALSSGAALRLCSMLYVPAHRWRMLEKALSGSISADAVILDLEDGVPPAEIATAHENLRKASRREWHSAPTVLCRVRSGPADQAGDIAALASLGLAGLVVPKVDGSAALTQCHQRCLEGGLDFELWPLIESAAGVEYIHDVLAAPCPVAGVMLGAGDLRADLHSSPDDKDSDILYARSRLVAAARANGFQHIIDTPDAALAYSERLLVSVRRARDLGMSGKAAVHPDQVRAINETFQPTPDEVAWAHAIVAAPPGATRVAGQLSDEATKRTARRILNSVAEPSISENGE